MGNNIITTSYGNNHVFVGTYHVSTPHNILILTDKTLSRLIKADICRKLRKTFVPYHHWFNNLNVLLNIIPEVKKAETGSEFSG